MFFNQKLLQCTVCGSILYSRPKGRWIIVDQLLWQIVAWAVVWRLHAPFIIGCILVFVLAFPYISAVDKLRYKYWLWRHPTRCDGAGHFKPAPQPL